MFVRSRRALFGALALLAAEGCSRTFTSPEKAAAPVFGAIDGTLSTAPRGDLLKGNDVALFLPDGTVAHTTTDAQGAFSFTTLSSGSYLLQVDVQPAPGGAHVFAEKLVPSIVVKAGQTTHLGVVAPTYLFNQPGASQVQLVGSVVANLHPDGGGLANPDAGVDLGGTQVAVYFAGDTTAPVAVTVAGSDGTFGQLLLPGTYDFKASNPLFVTGLLQGVVVGPDGGADGGLQYAPQALVIDINPAKLTGTVALEVNPDIVDGGSPDGGAFAPGAGVLVGTTFGGAGITNPDGVFTVANLLGKPDQAFFQALPDVHGQNYHDVARYHDVNLNPGATTDLGTVELLLDRGTIKGDVRMADGTPAQDISVSLTGTHFSVLATQDGADPALAHYAIPGVPALHGYPLVIHRAKYQDVTDVVSLDGDGSTTTVTLKVLTRLSGDLVVTSAAPASAPGFTDTTDVRVKLTNSTNAAIAGVRISEQPDFSLGDGGAAPYLPYPPSNDAGTPDPAAPYAFALSGVDQVRTVYVQYEDAALVPSEVFSASIDLDRSRPNNASVATASGKLFTSDNQHPKLALAASDSAQLPAVASGVRWMVLSTTAPDGGDLDAGALDGALLDYAAYSDLQVQQPQIADGPVQVYAQFVDNAGNRSAVATTTFVVDTVAPVGALSLAGPAGAEAGFTNSPLVQIAEGFGLEDGGLDVAPHEPNGGSITVLLANTYAASLTGAAPLPPNAVQSWYLDAAQDGVKTVWMRLVDSAGNTSGDYSATITLDRTPPSQASASYVGLPTPPGYGEPFTSAPAVTLAVSASDNYQLSASAALTVASDPGFTDVLAGPEAMPVNGQVDITLPRGDGHKDIYVRFQDAAGNATVVRAPITLQSAAPSGALALAGALADGTPSATLTASGTVSVTLSASGDALGVEFGDETLTGCPADPSSSAYQALPSGPVSRPLSGSANPRVVHACLVNGAGLTALLSASIAYDAVAPSSCALALTGVSKNGASAVAGKTASPTVSAAVNGCSETPTDLALSTSPLTCTGSGLPWQPFASPASFTLPGADGSYTVYACVRDAARNAASAGSAAMQLVQTAPQPSALLINGGAAYLNAAQAAASSRAVSVTGSASGATSWAVAEGAPPATSAMVSVATPFNPTLSSGDGVKTLYAVFRDAVGNLSAPVNASITVDTTAPTGGPASVQSYQGSGYVSSVSALVDLTSIGDATTVKLATASGVGCASVLDGSGNVNAPAAPAARYQTVLLPSGDGQKTVCAQLYDAAGNPGSVLSAPVTLDTTPPAVPHLTQANQLRTTYGAFALTTSAAAADSTFDHYEALGGSYGSWTSVSTNIATTSFTYTLSAPSSPSPTGDPYVLRLRAVDHAGNVSPEAALTVTVDSVAPAALLLNQGWVANGDGTVTILVKASASAVMADLASLKVLYGPASGNYSGTGANEGPSGFLLPASFGAGSTMQFTLTGLPDGQAVYVSVLAVDAAGNASAAPSPAEVVGQPNVQAASYIGSMTASPAMQLDRFAQQGQYLYAFGRAPCTPGFGVTTSALLAAFDLSGLGTPMATGNASVPFGLPVQTTPNTSAYTYADAVSCDVSNYGVPLDVAVDGPYLFTASGTKVRIFSLLNPAVPSLVTTLDLSTFAGTPASFVDALAPKGDRLFVSGRSGSFGTVWVVDVSKLYDQTAGSPAVASDVYAAQTGGGVTQKPASLSLVRDYLWEEDYAAATAGGHAINVTNSMSTPPTAASTAGASANFLGGGAHQDEAISGNLLYHQGSLGLELYDVSFAWTGAAVPAGPWLSYPLFSSGGYALAGSRYFAVDAVQGIQAMDLSYAANAFLPSMSFLGNTALGLPSGEVPTQIALDGNYAVVGTSGSHLLAYALALGRQAAVVRSGSGASSASVVDGAFVVSGNGYVNDLQTGTNLFAWSSYTVGTDSPASPSPNNLCDLGQVVIDGTALEAAGNTIHISQLDAAEDRSFGTAYPSATTTSSWYDFLAGSGVNVTGLDNWGDWLVAVEVHTTGTTGVFLHVLDLWKLRQHIPGSTAILLTNADDKGAFQIPGLAYTAGMQATVRLSGSRAFVAVDSGGSSASNGLYVVDLKQIFDDVAGNNTIVNQGFLASTGSAGARDVAVVGSRAFVATAQGVMEVDLTNVLTGSSVAGASVLSTTALTDAAALAAAGSTLYVAAVPHLGPGAQAQSTGALSVFDTATHGAPALLSTLQMGLISNASPLVATFGNTAACNTPTNTGSSSFSVYPRATITVQGSQAVVTATDRLSLVQLH